MKTEGFSQVREGGGGRAALQGSPLEAKRTGGLQSGILHSEVSPHWAGA